MRLGTALVRMSLLMSIVCVILRVLLIVAFLPLFERVVLSNMQRRSGRNVVGLQGVLQAIADAVKLLSKEVISRILSPGALFILSRVVPFGLSIMNWTVLRWLEVSVLSDMSLGLVYVLPLAMLSVYGVLISG